jgi:hypothetical protein
MIFLILIIVFNSIFKIRFLYQTNTLKNNIYFHLYKSGFEVFKNNKFFGVGNKNYRVETCEENQKK